MPSSKPAPASRLWLIAAAALLALALVIVAWGALQILLPPGRVLSIARMQLATMLRREVRLEGASVSLWPPIRVRLAGLAIGEPQGIARGAMLKTAALDVDLDPFALIVRRVVLRHVTLDHPVVHLALAADGSSNFDGLVPAPSASPAAPGRETAAPFDVAIQSFTIRGGQVVVDDARSARRMVFDVDTRIALSLEGATRIATEGRTTFSGFARGAIGAPRKGDLDRRLAALRLVIQHRGKFDAATRRLALERLALGFGKAEIVFAGVIDDVGGAHSLARLTAKGEGLDFGELLGAAALADLPAIHGLSGSGRMSFDLAIGGALDPARLPAVTGWLAVKDAAFRYPEAPASVSALSFTARFAPDSLGIPDLSARIAGQSVRASLALTRFQDPAVTFRASGAVDLAAVSPLVEPPPSSISGHATLDLSGSGRLRDLAAMDLTGEARLADVRVASPQLPKPMEHVAGTIQFSGRRATVRALSGASGLSSFTLDATVERPLALMAKPDSVPAADVTFSLRSPYLDLAELLPPTPGPALLPNARGTGHIEIGRLKQQRLDVRNVNASVEFDPVTMRVAPFALDGYGGHIAGSAKFDLRQPASPGFQIQAKVDSVQADALLSAWTPAKSLLKGSLNTTIDLSGAGTAPDQLKRSLTAVGLAAVTSGEIGPTPALESIAKLSGVRAFEKLTFRDMHMPFEVRDGRIAVHEMDLHSSSGDWKAAGLIGFDGALDLTAGALVPADQVAKLGAGAALAAGALSDDQGRIHLQFKLTGNAKNPTVSLDSRALRDQLSGRAKSALGEQGAKIERQLRQGLAPALLSRDSTGRAGSVDVHAVAESLKKIKGSDLLKSLFGTARKSAPPDTSKR